MKIIRSIILVLFCIAAGFLLGGLLASLSIQHPSGLAGAGIAAFYALFGGFIGLVISIILLLKASVRAIAITILLAGIIAFISIFILIRNKKARKAQRKMAHVSFASFQDGNNEMGLGMAQPNFYQNEVVYFYRPNLEKAVNEHLPIDSLVFSRSELGHELTYAPSWFYPVHLKMDYEILFLKVISQTKDWVQVIVNEQTQMKAWLSKHDVKIVQWPDFILATSSVKPIDEYVTLKVKPLDHAGDLSKKGSFYRAIEVRNEWLRVEILDEKFKKQGMGWLRWRKNGKLLITYDLLS